LRSREWFWIGAFVINLMALSVFLVGLNMKWPVLVYYVALVLCAFLFSRHRPYRNTALIVVGIGIAYVIVSVVVLRSAERGLASRQIAPPTSTSQQEGPKLNRKEQARPKIGASEYAAEVSQKSMSLAPYFVINGLNRMAVAYPYYYQVFTEEGPVCGTLMDRIMRKTNPCHPANLIYERMYGADGFNGVATAPAAIHISGYAVGGWSGALIATVLTALAIGLFMGFWPMARASTLAAAIFVMGGYTAYFFSQLPFEGPIIYDHGALWWAALLVGYMGCRIVIFPALSRISIVPFGRLAARLSPRREYKK
jgi:hypothetical protein